MEIIKKKINNEVYEVIPVLKTTYYEGSIVEFLDEKIRSDGRTPVWKNGYLERIVQLENKARQLFQTKEVGILYFVNGKEPEVEITKYEFKENDIVELAYINKNWKGKSLLKKFYFLSEWHLIKV